MKTYISIFLLMLSFIISQQTFSQYMYLPSQKGLVKVLSISDWEEASNVDYAGSYCQAYQSLDENGIMCDDILRIEFRYDKPILIFTGGYENGLLYSYDTLQNAYISSSTIFTDKGTGRFIELSYKNKKGDISKVKGIFMKNIEYPDFNIFYEKKK